MQLPVQFFGIFPTGGVITEEDQTLPWSDELEHKIFVSAIGQRPHAHSCCQSNTEPKLCLKAGLRHSGVGRVWEQHTSVLQDLFE